MPYEDRLLAFYFLKLKLKLKKCLAPMIQCIFLAVSHHNIREGEWAQTQLFIIKKIYIS